MHDKIPTTWDSTKDKFTETVRKKISGCQGQGERGTNEQRMQRFYGGEGALLHDMLVDLLHYTSLSIYSNAWNFKVNYGLRVNLSV